MANNSMKFNVDFSSSFDSSQILKGLQEIRKKMGDISADNTIFKGVDKDLAILTKQIMTLQAQSKNLSSGADFVRYSSQLERVRETANKVSLGLQNIATNDDKAFNFKDLQTYKKEMDQLNSDLKEMQGIMANSTKKLSGSLMGLGFDEGQTQKALQDLKEGVKLQDILNQELERRKEIVDRAYQNNLEITTDINPDDLKKYRNFRTDFAAKSGGDTASKQIDSIIRNALANYTGMLDYGDIQNFIKKSLQHQNLELANPEITMQKTKEIYDELINKIKEAKEEYEKALQSQSNFVEGMVNIINNENNEEYDLNISAQAEDYKLISDEIKNINNDIEAGQQAMGEDSENILQNLGEDAAGAQDQINNLVDAEKDEAAVKKEEINNQNQLNATFDKIGGIIKNVLSLGNAWRKANQYIRQTFEDVKRLDQAFASIAMVTKYSVGDLWGQYSQYSEIANRLGQTTEGAIKSSALFYQQGLDTNEVLSLTEDTLKMATLAGEDYTTATTQMTAAIRGFAMEMEEGNRVTDVYSELAANAAADVKGIAYAMSKTASIASNAGMEFETTAALITNMIETTQEAPENIGTAMKTIIARFTELKDNVEDSDEAIESMNFNKVDKALKSVGVQLKDTTGSFRNLDDVFLELSSKWDTLTRNQQRYIATIAA